jgi:DNA-binding transcriptional LysR family regulator
MELRHLEYFVAVVEEASFTRAAARVHVAQPGVSAQVRQLERELGEQLLDRSGKTVRLTDAGAAVLPYARAALSAAAGVQLAVDELSGLVRGRVAVGMISSWSAMNLPDVLADFYHQHPAVVITLSEANSSELLDGLAGGALDLALIGLAGAPPPGIDIQVVIDVPLVAVVSNDDPLAREASTTLAALGQRALMSLPHGTGLRAALESGCAAAGIRPRVAFEASEPLVLAHLAGRGLGVAILPESAAAGQGQLRTVPITGPGLRSRLALAWSVRAPGSPAARALIGHARSALGTVSQPGSDPAVQ